MEAFLDIIMVVIPVLLVCITFYLLTKEFFQNEEEKRRAAERREITKMLLPLKLQSYERAILFLERISPDNIVLRVHKSGMSSKLFHSELSKAIRTEFEHNLSQQLYLSTNSWELTRNAKEETQKLYNLAASKMNDTSTGIDLSHAIFQMAGQLDKLPTQIAIDYLKKEVHQNFG